MTRASILAAEDRLDEVVLRAPFDGVVAARMIEPAQRVQPGMPAFEIEDAGGGFQIEVNVPETMIDQIEAGSQHRAFILDGRETAATVRVHEIGTRANSVTGFPVTLDVLSSSRPIRAGMTAEVHLRLPLSTDDEDLVGLPAVPYTAVLPIAGEGYVAFVYDGESGSLRRREISIAGREGLTALVARGLEPGEIVAVRGLPFLRNDQRVALRGVGIARYDD